MRLFVAAELSGDLRDAVAARMTALRDALEKFSFARALRWVPEENLHLTVWFLGEVGESRAPAVMEALRSPLAAPAIPLAIAGFGTFPPSGNPRVLWMGVPSGLAELTQAHAEVGARLAPLGFAPEGRPYSAHLTLARIKSPLGPADRAPLRRELARIPSEAGACRVDALTLFRSRTSPKGAVYEPLLRVPLS